MREDLHDGSSSLLKNHNNELTCAHGLTFKLDCSWHSCSLKEREYSMSPKFGLQEFDTNSPPPPVEKCDVSKPKELAKYRKKREEWLGWYEFRKDEPNSIEGQIIRMTFEDMSYRMMTKPRGETSQDVKIAARNGLLVHMLDIGYAATQILAIRRLLDKGSDVMSMQRLLNSIKANRKLITRENYVAYDGKPYGPDGWQSLPASPEIQMWGAEAPGLYGYLMSGERHKLFDKLSGVSVASRSRQDLISVTIFERLEGWLRSVEAEKLVTLSHKFFAHAAGAESRGNLTLSGFPLGDIEKAQRAIVRVERAITDDILFIGVAREVVAMQPLGFLHGLDAPYVTTEMIAKMNTHWDELKAERNTWSKGYEDDLYS
jgi:hypothetical protein